MTWLADPKTREPLAALPVANGPQRHAGDGWVLEYDEGIPVRMRWWECRCPVHQAEIDALNAEIESGAWREGRRMAERPWRR